MAPASTARALWAGCSLLNEHSTNCRTCSPVQAPSTPGCGWLWWWGCAGASCTRRPSSRSSSSCGHGSRPSCKTGAVMRRGPRPDSLRLVRCLPCCCSHACSCAYCCVWLMRTARCCWWLPLLLPPSTFAPTSGCTGARAAAGAAAPSSAHHVAGHPISGLAAVGTALA